ncbi:hypothetical protein BDQ12DRAFT_688589 [Crucibulum laeve]|uniref:Uncharacterized protein n=1 Tax=Crucibulum laeve TaxID=68775 RepID=A0A5C3LRC7_9AGAR|nr:hypothetical protein BDQ12DRAFT_688589 [Crucibulum laeve]
MPVFSDSQSSNVHNSSFNDISGSEMTYDDSYVDDSVDYGDTFNGYISRSTVGGRGNSNSIINEERKESTSEKCSRLERELEDTKIRLDCSKRELKNKEIALHSAQDQLRYAKNIIYSTGVLLVLLLAKTAVMKRL